MNRDASCLLLHLAGCGSKASVCFDIDFRGGAPSGPLFIWAAVEESADTRVPSPILGFVGPVEYSTSGVELSIQGIPFGRRRVVPECGCCPAGS